MNARDESFIERADAISREEQYSRVVFESAEKDRHKCVTIYAIAARGSLC